MTSTKLFSAQWLAQGPGELPACPGGVPEGLDLWTAVDGSSWRAYAPTGPAPAGLSWVALSPLLDRPGASEGAEPSHHYVVETDVAPEVLEEFTAWYDTEHLPGLARVPGTVRARRLMRQEGHPRFVACYDLTTPLTLERPEWLAVRYTPWSDRVRTMFRGTVRTMYRRAQRPST